MGNHGSSQPGNAFFQVLHWSTHGLKGQVVHFTRPNHLGFEPISKLADVSHSDLLDPWDLIVFLQSIRKQGLVHAPGDLFLQKGLNFTKLSMLPPKGCFQRRLRRLGDRPSKRTSQWGWNHYVLYVNPVQLNPVGCLSGGLSWWIDIILGYLPTTTIQPLYQSGVEISYFYWFLEDNSAR